MNLDAQHLIRTGVSSRLVGARVLDLFCREGQFGRQSLLRGARHATFVDLSVDHLHSIERFCRARHFEASVELLCADALEFIPSRGRSDPFRVVWIEPPRSKLYDEDFAVVLFQQIHDLLASPATADDCMVALLVSDVYDGPIPFETTRRVPIGRKQALVLDPSSLPLQEVVEVHSASGATMDLRHQVDRISGKHSPIHAHCVSSSMDPLEPPAEPSPVSEEGFTRQAVSGLDETTERKDPTAQTRNWVAVAAIGYVVGATLAFSFDVLGPWSLPLVGAVCLTSLVRVLLPGLACVALFVLSAEAPGSESSGMTDVLAVTYLVAMVLILGMSKTLAVELHKWKVL